jgi:PAS domain-containing protein
VLQQLRDGIVLSDAEGNMVFVNDAAEQIRNVCGVKISSARAWWIAPRGVQGKSASRARTPENA